MELNQFIDASIEHFYKVTGRKLKNTETRTRLLKRIHKAGYTIEQVQFVIENKYMEWKDNKEMKKYIRPETLFAFSKFETYVDEEPIGDKCGQSYNQLNKVDEDHQKELERYKEMFGKK